MSERNEEQRRKELFEQIQRLDDVIHVLESTANVWYPTDSKMWIVLLRARDKLKVPIEAEQAVLLKEVKEIDAAIAAKQKRFPAYVPVYFSCAQCGKTIQVSYTLSLVNRDLRACSRKCQKAYEAAHPDLQ
jgi:hypothetical protein